QEEGADHRRRKYRRPPPARKLGARRADISRSATRNLWSLFESGLRMMGPQGGTRTMGSVNKVILVGNLGADPELKYTPSSRPLCNLRIATTDVFKDKSGQRQERTEWHRVTVWGDQAENCNKYLSKGRSVYVEGRLQTRSYDKEVQKHYATDVVA